MNNQLDKKELSGMILILGECQSVIDRAKRLYQERYSDKQQPNQKVLKNILDRFHETGSVDYKTRNKKEFIITEDAEINDVAAIGDILITIFCVPFTSVSYLQQYWSFGGFLCPVVNYSQAVSVFVSAYTMVAISVDRYTAIIWPLRPKLSKKVTTLIIVIVWIIAGMTAFPIPVFSKLGQPTEWYQVCDRYLCHEDWSVVGQKYEKLYTVSLMILQYIIPLTVLLFTYVSIAIVICCHRIPGEAENSRDRRIAKSKRKMIKMMVTVVFVFTLCWLPFNILWITAENINDEVKMYLWFACHWLAMSHACYNPIIYCYMNSRFRLGFFQALNTVPCCKKWIPSVTILRPRSSTGFPLTKQHWTKVTYLKLTAERLHENLGALEFDADHEAIYGMEKYYTVEQREKVRDKYKIGSKYCSQCLMKHMSEIGLQHFLDTINKYIKDCSDSGTSSSSSSDEEECKSVEQNDKDSKMTEEKELKKIKRERITKPVL
ncbi:hypothetical protein FQA39_LY09116 [Lamprigera yunnana]|nr:hypothetical protein FQA39_LY09116 [Lamprigera yunnana]